MLFRKRMPAQSAESLPRTQETELGMMDQPYLLLTLLLTLIGLIMLLSASYARAYYETGNAAGVFVRQLGFAAAGVAILLFVSRVPYEWYNRFCVLVYLVGAVLLLLVLLIGGRAGGAKRWLNLGFNFQPSEVAKFALILILASMLSIYRDRMKQFKTLVLCCLPTVGYAVLLYFEPHFSAIIILLAITFVMLLLAGGNRKILIGGGLLCAGAMVGLLLVRGYTGERISAWLHPENDPLDSGLQILQSLYAIGSGGLLGLGFGQSRQKYLYLPEEHNDYIFAIVCEELGFLGAFFILLLFAMLIIRGFWIAVHARDRFSMLLAAGLTTLLAVQVILNVAVVTNLLPATGISLPFFSYGGTALLMQMAECGMVLNISRSIDANSK